MKLELLSETTYEVLQVKQAQPTHDDTCDRCGECLACCGRQRCETARRENDSPYRHRWVKYVGHPDPESDIEDYAAVLGVEQ